MENVIDFVWRYNLDFIGLYALMFVALFGCGWGAASARANIKLAAAEQKLKEANEKLAEVARLKAVLNTLHTQLSDMAGRYYCAGVWSVVAKLQPETWEFFRSRRLKRWIHPRFLPLVTEDELGVLCDYAAVKGCLPDEAALPSDRRPN